MSKSTVKSYKHTVWKACATFIKLRDADSNGIAKCVTCPKLMSIYDPCCNAGHFVLGHNNSTYFDDAHIFCQCYMCNHYGRGEQGKYGLFLKKKYGYTDMMLEEILATKQKTKKVTMEELKDIKKTFDEASAKLRKEKGLK